MNLGLADQGIMLLGPWWVVQGLPHDIVRTNWTQSFFFFFFLNCWKTSICFSVVVVGDIGYKSGVVGSHRNTIRKALLIMKWSQRKVGWNFMRYQVLKIPNDLAMCEVSDPWTSVLWTPEFSFLLMPIWTGCCFFCNEWSLDIKALNLPHFNWLSNKNEIF